MSNTGRELTIRIKIVDGEAANWLWEACRRGKSEHGISIEALSDTDLFAERDDDEKAIDWMLTQLSYRAAVQLEQDILDGVVPNGGWATKLLDDLKRV